jgi:UDPglucose 6-dehydrogenase
LRISNISVVGLGKLGLCLANVIAYRGFRVTGVDTDEKRIALINNGVSPIYEPGLKALIRKNRSRFKATKDYFEAILPSNVTFVVVPTPSDQTGRFSLDYVTNAMKGIGEVLKRKKGYHLVVLSSTIMPKSMDRYVQPILEQNSGKVCGRDFGLCYNPEFIALGDVLRGLMEPDFVLIGQSDEKAGKILEQIQRRLCENAPPIERMNFVNAEIAKISLNSFVTMKMSFANSLAEICENVEMADADRITRAIGKDKRIGSSYLKGALGYGGPCFPRDNVAFSSFARDVGVHANLAEATDDINRRQVYRIFKILERENAKPPMKIGVLGLTYKPKTNVTEASQALQLAQRLATSGFEVLTYDPALKGNSLPAGGLRMMPSAESCVRASNVCIIATPWDAFRKIKATTFSEKIVIDCWGVLSDKSANCTSKYFSTGKGYSIIQAIAA